MKGKPQPIRDPSHQLSRPRRRLWRWVAVVLIILVAVVVGGVETTSRSSFCNNCHIMNTYYESWESDTHHDTPCVECHIPPGPTNYIWAKLNGLGQVADDWLNRTSTKPSASVSDFACTRSGCHVMEDLGAVESEDRPYLFDHRRHLQNEYEGVAIQCTTCHSHVKGDRHFEVNTNVCVTCHLLGDLSPTTPGAESSAADGLDTPSNTQVASSRCTDCHEAPDKPFGYQGLTVDHHEYQQYGAACESCHRNVTERPHVPGDAECLSCHVYGIERAGDMPELHRIHTRGAHKVECFSCHGVTRHGPGAESMTLDQFDCRSCHAAQHAVQRNTYLSPSSEAHVPGDRVAVSPMFLAHVDCTGCHIEPRKLTVSPFNGATVAAATSEACDACHRTGSGEQMISLWQRSTHQIYDEAFALLPTEKSPWASDDPVVQREVDQARRLLELVRVDGSWGVHNPLYTQLLIEQARKRLIEAGAPINTSAGASR